MHYLGINIGAVTVKVVGLDTDPLCFRVVRHQGRPLQVVEQLVQEFPIKTFYGVSGHLGHISEIAATEAALEYIGGEFDAVVSLGGETFAVYLLEGTRILNVLSHNKCAAGSGEFFIQQIGRFGLDLESAINCSFEGKVVPLASRCSVHCKSDITHKLNRQEATIADILHSLHDSMASKVISLLEKGQRPVNRLLAIGGLAQNRAMIAALKDKLPKTQVVVLPESPFFEALGTAVLTRADPIYESPSIILKTSLGTLPGLSQYENCVTRSLAQESTVGTAGPFVLGVDVGSTTTKSVLLDIGTRRVVASHYGLTGGNPLASTRQCLRDLKEQVGMRQASLVAVTGSGRDLIGAYLGTSHVYNEISAHATGAVQFDSLVDTIFEIGGQDSKYIFLRNGVPVDYVMNSACSGGTGSFLEECAQSDLCLQVAEIAEVALRADAPVHFKATCAAFINSDIRAALQEGYSRNDVTAGLVYAIVHNYLNTVKGRRPVGKRVFFQGGVAMNVAVGHAFAQCLDRHVVIPPHPELMGAIGVALLALERSDHLSETSVDLADLAAPSMTVVGHFTCHGCDNCCAIDKFQVAGRQFPFGGRCSLYENVRKKEELETKQADDLVDTRNKLILTPVVSQSQETSGRIGIPRALTTHSLYPLYATFFQQLGLEVVLSDIDPAGWLKANSAFCFPVQIAHGAVLDLVNRGVEMLFLPHVNKMPNIKGGKDSFLCLVSQASPYFISKAFPQINFLSPVLDFSEGYDTCAELMDVASDKLGYPRQTVEQAYSEAVRVQVQTEQSMLELGQQALADALEDPGPSVVLVGRSYNAFPAEASQSVAKKLYSMGIRVIPGDCLPRQNSGSTSWHFPNIILNAAELTRKHRNLFLLYVSNFSCTIDAFVHSMLSSELGNKPFLMLEIDSHTADAGIQTRLEAFLDITENHQLSQAGKSNFTSATISSDGVVTTSSNKRFPLTDPRVKLYFPCFSHYHSRAIALVARWQGLNLGSPIELDRHQLECGLRFTSGRECLPFPVSIGQMLEAHQQRQTDEIVGFYMMRGGAPCVVDCYVDYFHQFIKEHHFEDLFIFDPREANNYYGLGVRSISQALAPVISLADIFVEMEQVLRVVGESDSQVELRNFWDKLVSSASSMNELKNSLATLVEQVSQMPHRDPTTCPRVLITGDFFTRFNPAFMEGVHDLYARHGIILLPVDLNEIFLYGTYARMVNVADDWGVSPNSLWAAVLACTRAFRPEGRSYITNWVQYWQLMYFEQRYRKLFERTGLLVGRKNDMDSVFRHASQHISPAVFGEAIPTVGKAIVAGSEGYSGIIVIGPFNCLPFRISEAILKPVSIQKRMPILTYESDGFSVSPSFLRKVDVHIQQVINNCRQKT